MTTTTSTAETMSLAEALRERRSVRGYRPEPVPQAVLDEVFGLAQLAPSNCNIQPWKVFVASGAMRDELRHRMVEHVTKGDPIQPDFEHLPNFEGVYRKRQVDCAVELYNNMGIARDDREGREWANLRNFELMTSFGIGSCAQGSMRYYPQDVRDLFGEPDSTAILCGISFGYEDQSVAANRTRVGREPLGESVRFRDSV